MAHRVSIRRPYRNLLAIVLIATTLVSGLATQRAVAQPAPTVVNALCASPWTGALYYQPNGCLPGYQEIDLTAGEVTVCANRYTGQVSIPRGTDCPPTMLPLILGGAEPVTLCSSLYTGAVRYSPGGTCLGKEAEVIAAAFSADCLTSGDCPRPLPEVTDTIGAITSDIVVNDPAGGQITDVNVVIDVSHAWLTDLDIYLESPAGTVVELFTDVCTVEVDLDVTLDDEAATSIDAVACTPQITGTFQPVGSLSDFDGELASGTWQLQVTDDASANAGLLWDWSLEITTTNGVLPTAGCTDCFLLIPGTSGAAAPHGVTVSRITAAAPAGLQIADLNLTVDISHTFLGDLHIHLLSPSGTHVKVFEQACGVAVDMQAVFDDEAATGFDCDNRLGFNSYQPDPGLLSAFDNESASGTWTLVVIDDSNVDAGTLNDWALGFLLN